MKLIDGRGSRGAKRLELLLHELEERGTSSLQRVMPAVERIVRDVQKNGDKALLRYREKFDGVSQQLQVHISREAMRQAWEETPAVLREAMEIAAANIADFAYRQMPQEWSCELTPGVTTGQRVRPLDAVGCYVPSGRHPLPSTLLMTVIPAHVAGVKKIVVVSPKPARETLAAAHLLRIEHFFQIGGAQAVAALAYGTASIPCVDKIVGPGNLYVTAAKKLVAFDCGIDMLAGPTEIVVTSEQGNPTAIAADLVAQAEHDPEALAIFVTSNKKLAKRVAAETNRQAKTNPVAKEALAENGYVFVAGSVTETHQITNRLVPEHLTVDSEADLTWVKSAGSVFVGHWSAQPLGDYISGPNHTLPTGGIARVRGGLSVLDYVKLITVQEYSADGLARLGHHAVALAEAEGLSGHAEAIRVRGVNV